MRQHKTFWSAALVFFLALGLLVAAQAARAESPRNPAWAQPLEVEGLDNLHQVTDDLYRSGQPTETGFLNAEKMGIRTVLNLRSLHGDSRKIRGTNLKLLEVPISTGSMDEEELIEALRAIRLAEKPVLVHCWHGADRTGTVTVFYRVLFQGWTKEEARAEMTEGGYGYHTMWTNLLELIEKTDIERIRQAVEQ